MFLLDPSLRVDNNSEDSSLREIIDEDPKENNNLEVNHNTSVSNESSKITRNENIENLSNYTLNENEVCVLSKGLTFCPTSKFNQIELVSDALSFARKIKLKYYFNQKQEIKESKTPLCLSKFKEASDFEPDDLPPDHPIEQFVNVLISNLSDPNFDKGLNKSNKNLSKEEFSAINSLKNNKEIVILPADKGNKIVVLNKEDYINEAKRQLLDLDVYQPLKKDPTKTFIKSIGTFLKTNEIQEELSKETIDLLIPKVPKTPVFYTLPKIHKEQRPPLGRPIVAGIGGPTERISSFVDDQLQPFVKSLKSYVKDTNDFLEKLTKNIKQPIKEDIILVTADVESLYTNITHAEGLKAVNYFLNQRPNNVKPSTEFLSTLAEMVLTMNAFRFENNFYLQSKGTAMGTRMAPSYANLYMGLYEENFLNNEALKPLAWFRFIDDIFFVWPHGMNSLQNFLQNLQTFSNLNFTWKISKTLITFLDVDIFIDKGILKSKIHIKDTNTMEYLHFMSCHPLYVKKSVPKGLAVRAERLCSDQNDFQEYIQKLTSSFEKRGYPKKTIKKQIQNSKTINQNSKNKKDNQTNNPKFITKFVPGLHKINGILKTVYPILKNSPETKDLFSEPPKITFKKPNNLKNILVRPKLPPSSSNKTSSPLNFIKSSEPCKKPRCGTCKMMNNTRTFKSEITNKIYHVNDQINCDSKNVIYQINCNNCEKQYIGQTSNHLRIRMTGHRFDMFHKDLRKPLVTHAQEHKEDTLEKCYNLTAVNKVEENQNEKLNRLNLRRCEQAHQLVLKSKVPSGLNLR